MKTIPQKTARELYDETAAAVAEWAKAVHDLETSADAANGRRAETPADLASVADEQIRIERRLDLARASLASRTADLDAAARVVVVSDADLMQPSIDEALAKVATIDKKTAQLRRALDDHLRDTHDDRQDAATSAAALTRIQAGLRAAAAGEPVREYFGRVEDLPASLHPQTGILPQMGYQDDLDRAAAAREWQERLAEGRRVLDEIGAEVSAIVAAKLPRQKVKALDLDLSVAHIDSYRAADEVVAQVIMETEFVEDPADRAIWARILEQAGRYAEAGSFAQVARAFSLVRDHDLASDHGEVA